MEGGDSQQKVGCGLLPCYAIRQRSDEKKTARAEARAVVSSGEFDYGMVIWIVLLFDSPPLSTTVSVIDGVAPAGKG